MYSIADYLKLDKSIKIIFSGSETAELFTREIRESLDGVLQKNYCYDEKNCGFISASVDGRPWTDTMWTRDAGVFLRELIHYGYLGRACLTALKLMELCDKNEDGYYAFPQLFELGKKSAGRETDGTAAILVAFALLVRELLPLGEGAAKECLEKITRFMTGSASPIRFIAAQLENEVLICGTGEFGGGMGADGEYYNVVQNCLAANALYGWTETFHLLGDAENANLSGRCYDILIKNIQKYLIDPADGTFIWCVERHTCNLPQKVLNSNENLGFTGINGAGAMISDVLTRPEYRNWWGRPYAQKTFLKLLNKSCRREQYDKYGIYIQFEKLCCGLLTSPSYGQGYALALALQYDMTDIAEKLLHYLVSATYSPPPRYNLTRESPYWIYERMLSPDYFGLPEDQQTIDEGCGALNLVNVAEVLKIARLIAGVEFGKQSCAPILVKNMPACTVER